MEMVMTILLVTRILVGTGYDVARSLRAVIEPMLVSHFGKGIIEDVFPKYRKMIADYMSREKTEFTNVTVSLVKTRKAVKALPGQNAELCMGLCWLIS
nr:salicylate carboxymethyltransferase-like [Ipomoea trifida]